jgi:hypothetical protein
MAADDRVTLHCTLSAIFRSRWRELHGPAELLSRPGSRKMVPEHLLRGFNQNANVRWMKQALG